MEVGEYTEVNFNSRYIYLATLLEINEGDSIYALFKNDYVELRTKEQYDSLILKLDRSIERADNIGDKNKYNNLRSSIRRYSRMYDVVQKKRIFFGLEFVRRYSIGSSITIEQCNDCLKLWNPNMFRIKHDDSDFRRGRR